MKITKAFLLGATALVGIAAFGGTAHAIPTNFTSGSLAIQAVTSTTSALGSTTSFSLSTPTNLVSGAGDFTGLSANGIGLFGPTLLLSDATTFDFSAGALGSFAAAAGPVELLPSAPGVLSFFIAGTYTIGSDFTGNAGTTLSGDETFSLTQTNGAGNAISISGTFQSPEVPPTVPEPATLAVFGMGLLGLGALRLRKKA